MVSFWAPVVGSGSDPSSLNSRRLRGTPDPAYLCGSRSAFPRSRPGGTDPRPHQSPADLRTLRREELHQLVADVRKRHIDVVAAKGGHFGAALGVAELTVALHYVYDTPRDKTGLGHRASGLYSQDPDRSQRALPDDSHASWSAPFLRRNESPYDVFGAGHAATSISAAWGIATARDLTADDFRVVAVIGTVPWDAASPTRPSITGATRERDFTVIPKRQRHVHRACRGCDEQVPHRHDHEPRLQQSARGGEGRAPPGPDRPGQLVEEAATRLEESLKHLLTPGLIFEELGFRYVGPIDGHDLDALTETLGRVRKLGGPILVHVITRKGKGFDLARRIPGRGMPLARSTRPRDAERRRSPWPPRAAALPEGVRKRAHGVGRRRSQRVIAITAAMPDGTSTDIFSGPIPSGISTWASRKPWRHVRRRARHRGDAAGGGDLFHVPAARVRLDRCTMSRFRTSRSSSAWTGLESPVKTDRLTTVRSTSATCCACRG